MLFLRSFFSRKKAIFLSSAKRLEPSIEQVVQNNRLSYRPTAISYHKVIACLTSKIARFSRANVRLRSALAVKAKRDFCAVANGIAKCAASFLHVKPQFASSFISLFPAAMRIFGR